MKLENFKVKFIFNNEQLGGTFIQNINEYILVDKVPQIPKFKDKDFLGWFWGKDLKYKAIFPLNLLSIPKDILNNLNGEIVFVAKFGKHMPPNPINKNGYRLIFQEEFECEELDKNKFVDSYLSCWSIDYKNTKQWEINNSIISLKIEENSKPWCFEYGEETVVSAITTGDRNGLHNWNKTNEIRNPIDTKLTHINQYGYYEIRAKCQAGSSRHCAWWLLGFEDIDEESVEVDIFEVLGKENHIVPSALHKWNDLDAFSDDFNLGEFKDLNSDFNNEWHIYGFEWQEGTGKGNFKDKFIFYIDNKKWAEVNVNINYPLIQLFSVYEKRKGGWTGDWEWMPYPNTFEIDYIRVYKKLPNMDIKVKDEDLKILDIIVEDLNINYNDIQLKTYCNYTEKNLKGTKSYVRVLWNDGIETQEPVIWECITKEDLKILKSKKSIQKYGFIKSLNKNVKMKINVV